MNAVARAPPTCGGVMRPIMKLGDDVIFEHFISLDEVIPPVWLERAHWLCQICHVCAKKKLMREKKVNARKKSYCAKKKLMCEKKS